MNFFISLSEMSFPDTLFCVFCGENKRVDEFWFYQRSEGSGRCRSCMSLGVTQTDFEKYKTTQTPFVPVVNLDFFQSNFEDKEHKENGGNDEVLHIVRFAPQGSLIEFSPRLPVKNIHRNWRRGEIVSFSVRSRSRLNKKIAMLQRGVVPAFVTLTYHEDIPQDFEGYKYHLDLFLKWLFRKFPSAGVIWKLEFQKRGYAHFHLFIWGVSVDDLQVFVPDTWYKIAGNHSTYHLAWHKGELGNKNEHCVQPIRSWNGVRSYASKYFSKLDDEKSRGGRVWGVRGKVPFSKLLEFRVNLAVALEFRHSLAQARQYEFQRLGFWCMDFSADWLIFLDELITANEVLNRPPDDPPDWDLEEPILFEDFFGVPVEVFQDA